MKVQQLLSALALVMATAMPAMAQGHSWNRGHGQQHGQAVSNQCPVTVAPTSNVGWHHGRGAHRQAQVVVYTPTHRHAQVVTSSVPVYVPVQRVVYQPVPVRTQPKASVTFRVTL